MNSQEFVKNVFLCAVHVKMPFLRHSDCYLSWTDLSTGELHHKRISAVELHSELTHIGPRELLVCPRQSAFSGCASTSLAHYFGAQRRAAHDLSGRPNFRPAQSIFTSLLYPAVSGAVSATVSAAAWYTCW